MFKKSLIFCLMLLCMSATVWSQTSGMSDQQVMMYVQNGMQQGKSQQQLTSELARMGVTKQQAERIKRLYQQSQKNGTNLGTTLKNSSRIRTKEGVAVGMEGEMTNDEFGLNPITPEGVESRRNTNTSLHRSWNWVRIP